MGFTIETYSLYGLPPLPNIYVSIQGSYSIKKNHPIVGAYMINYTIYYSSANGLPGNGVTRHPVVSEKPMFTCTQALPSPADVYSIIYQDIKKTLDPQYGTVDQTLVFTDDVVSLPKIPTGEKGLPSVVVHPTIDHTIDTTIDTSLMDPSVVDEAKLRYEEMRMKAQHYRTTSGRIRLDIPEERSYPVGVFSPPSEPGDEPLLNSVE